MTDNLEDVIAIESSSRKKSLFMSKKVDAWMKTKNMVECLVTESHDGTVCLVRFDIRDPKAPAKWVEVYREQYENTKIMGSIKYLDDSHRKVLMLLNSWTSGLFLVKMAFDLDEFE